jgi:hypothetical protein
MTMQFKTLIAQLENVRNYIFFKMCLKLMKDLHTLIYDVAQGVALPNVTLKERYKRIVSPDICMGQAFFVVIFSFYNHQQYNVDQKRILRMIFFCLYVDNSTCYVGFNSTTRRH